MMNSENVQLTTVALIPTGMQADQMGVLLPDLLCFFAHNTPIQVMFDGNTGLSVVEMKLQTELVGVDLTYPVRGNEDEWLRVIDKKKRGVAIVMPHTWINYFADKLFVGYVPNQTILVGDALVGKYGTNSVRALPSKL